ncbi:hypothetical protein MYCTH_2061852 [Thermothelomyces thermophilus ATCC 42464]|uniref:Uncharacterized protein n=1 Tax=Thermothelomyces thermophilus (strain ATCC 42464 / BCRC 31852 / DSM 1799) TaxID=573729 RepID=G2QDE5_THET4|nr:uncharacterized protein MYCTH_2061852 [Thermothelomyces thermophilus ATCC 42464]AEO58310.1 hypothetical protein MYCTH_2061852 [Thermothelomyces thermophilus ATCC 42464]
MGYFVGVTSTGFVGTGEMSAVTSYMPCHIFGDQMLIGAGIRIGFYLLYAAAIVAVLFGVDKQFRLWHGAWGILALSLFTAMFLNAVDSNLIIIDYAVLIHLVLWYPVYFVITVLFRQALVVDSKDRPKSDAEYLERLQRCRRVAVTRLDVERARAYADVLKAFALHAAEEEALAEHDNAQAALGRAIHHFVSHWHEQIEVRDGRSSEDVQIDGGAVTTVYNTELIQEIAAAPTRADIDKLRDLYVAALVHSQQSVAEARATEQEVALIASEELRIRRRARAPKHSLRHFLLTTSYKDQLTAALGLLIWSAFMFGTAALNWPLLHNGNKPGGTCDNVPTVYFVLAPKKPFADPGFTTFLRIWTVGVCLVAVVTTALGLFILTVSLLGPTAVGLRPWWRRRKGDKKRSVEDGPRSDVAAAAADPRSARGYSHKARGRHTQEILACLHHSETRSVEHRYRSRTTAPARFSLWTVPWAVLLAVLLVVTVVCAELTVTRQGERNNVPLDFARPPLRETSEILAFLIGLYALIVTLLSVVGAFAAAVLRNRRRKNSVRGEEEGHHHDHDGEKGRGAKESVQPGLAY